MSEEIESIVTDENIESEEITTVETETAPSARDLIFAQREADLLEEAGESKPVIDADDDNEPVPVIQSKHKVKINVRMD